MNPSARKKMNIWGQSKNPNTQGQSTSPDRQGVFALTPVLKYSVTVVVCLVLLTACHRNQEQNAELFVFGTIVEIKLWGATQEQSDRAFAELQQMFNGMHRDWHAWEPGGRLTDINKAFALGQTAEADADIVEIIRRSQGIEQRSGGRFNPAIGGLISLWGFHTSDYPIIGPPPNQASIDEILTRHPSSRDIHIDGLQLKSENPHVQLDFGGIAKGYAVDLAIARVRDLGITSAIVNAGGDLRAIGRHGDRPWNVAVRKPGGGIIGAVEIRGDEALFTSGNYERFRQDQLKRYPHILDGWPAVAQALDLHQVLVVDESGMVYLTPEMERRMQFSGDVDRVIMDVSVTR
jgi:thiamine biosynthesis lipoprotein